MVGSAIVRALQKQGETNIVARTHAELDLTNQAAVQQFFAQEKPTQVYLAAAKVGGIHANNTYPADFIYQNLMVQANVADAALRNVRKIAALSRSECYVRRHDNSSHAQRRIIQSKPIVHPGLLARPITPVHATNLRHRHVGLVND